MATIVIEPIEEKRYDYIIKNLNDWFGGRNMMDMLPRLFFKHFRDTSFIAVSDNQIVGFIVAFLSSAEKDTGYIHFVGVHPEFRKQGVGRMLYQTFFNLSNKQGIKKINCVTSPINTTSINFHHSMGFKASGYNSNGSVSPLQDYDGPGNHRILFIKEL